VEKFIEQIREVYVPRFDPVKMNQVEKDGIRCLEPVRLFLSRQLFSPLEGRDTIWLLPLSIKTPNTLSALDIVESFSEITMNWDMLLLDLRRVAKRFAFSTSKCASISSMT
jgi:hypothetical protein